MQDNKKSNWGNDDDLQIYHSGHSVVQNTNAAAFLIASDETQVLNNAMSETQAKFINNGAVELYYDNSKKLETSSIGATIHGRATIGGDSNTLVSSFSTTNSSGGYIEFNLAHSGGNIGYIGNPSQLINTGSQNDFAIRSAANLRFAAGGSALKATLDSNGHFYPATNNVSDLGASSLRWRNIYVNDLQLSNEAKKDTGGNDVDGTWGDWTLQEGDENIFMINNRTGKKYKMGLQEVD